MNKLINWDELGKEAKLGLTAGAVVIVLLTIGMLFWIFSDSTDYLFRNMDEKEAANVITALEGMKVSYTLKNSGKDILVDEARAQELKLKLVAQGVTNNVGHGFVLFDNADIGMTEYSQKINYLRALQGELARSIMTIEGIKYARVHLVLPEASIFRQKNQKSSASVNIIPEPGVVLIQDQILGIQRLVAAATPGINQEDVMVINNNGITLSSSNTAANADNVATLMLQKKKEAEQYFENKVNAILDKTFGVNASIVTISVDLVVDKVHRKDEIVLPAASKDAGVVRKRELKSAGTKEAATDGASTIEIEYQLSRRVEEIITMPGAIRRIDVGVLVPEDVSDAQLAHLKEIIARSVGLQHERGDDLSIYPMKIDVISAVIGNKQDKHLVAGSESATAVNATVFDKVSIKYLLIAVAAILLLLVFVIFYAVKSGKLPVNRGLTMEEKNRLLSQLKELLAHE